jgi:CO/xanthine dehydrogenase FAD-binding subunit
MEKFLAPKGLKEALEYLYSHPGTRVLAGGTDILVKFHERLDEVPSILDITKLQELKDICVNGDEVRLGALVTHREIEDHPWLKANVPSLCQGATEVGAMQIRNRGTIGGNVVNASPAGDTLPPLVVLGGRVELSSLTGQRTMSLEEFFLGPGKTALKADELLIAITFPTPKPHQGNAYLKLGKRKALAIATASVAVNVTLNDDMTQLEDIRICFGSVAPVPKRCLATEEVLRGKSLTDLPWAEATAALQEDISPIDDIRGTAQYRRDVASVILVRATKQAIRETGAKLYD